MVRDKQRALVFIAGVAGVCLAALLLLGMSGSERPQVAASALILESPFTNRGSGPLANPVGPSLTRSDAHSSADAARLAGALERVDRAREEKHRTTLEALAREADDTRVRIRALRAMAKEFGERAGGFLQARAENGDEVVKVRAEAARLVGLCGDQAAERLACLRRYTFPLEVRRGATLGLALVGSAECADTALDLAGNPIHPLRSAAVEALARMRKPAEALQIARFLVAGFEAPSPPLEADGRVSACLPLGRSRIPEATAPLLALLAGDRSPAVRAAAAHALGLLGDRTAADALSIAKQDSDPEVARGAQLAWNRLARFR